MVIMPNNVREWYIVRPVFLSDSDKSKTVAITDDMTARESAAITSGLLSYCRFLVESGTPFLVEHKRGYTSGKRFVSERPV